jgi:hypothetical protein
MARSSVNALFVTFGALHTRLSLMVPGCGGRTSLRGGLNARVSPAVREYMLRISTLSNTRLDRELHVYATVEATIIGAAAV